MTGNPLTGKPATSPDHFGPSRCATEVTTTTVRADAHTRIARIEGDARTGRSTAVSGSRRTNQAVATHTTAANGITVTRVSGITPTAPVPARNAAEPTPTPAATDRDRGPGTSRVPAR